MKPSTLTKSATFLAFLTVISLFVLAANSSAQLPQKPSSSTERVNKEQAQENSRERNSSGCTTRFDRFRDRNTITIEPHTIYRAGADELKLGASAIVEASNAASREIDLLFDSTANRLRYGNSAEVRFIVDGKRKDGGVAYKSGGYAMRQVNEQLRLTMPTTLFIEIIAGREVEMQIGETEVRLRREDLERLQAFATCAGLRVEQR